MKQAITCNSVDVLHVRRKSGVCYISKLLVQINASGSLIRCLMVLTALVLRVAIALSTRGFFQPDEYFQALEPAHHYVFGYGHLTWEWVSPAPLRSMIYPALNIPPFLLLKALGLDTRYPDLLVSFVFMPSLLNSIPCPR